MNGRDRVYTAAHMQGWTVVWETPVAVELRTRSLEVTVRFGSDNSVCSGSLSVTYPDTTTMSAQDRRNAILSARADSRNAMTGRSKKADTVVAWLTNHRPSLLDRLWLIEHHCDYCCLT